jgi:AraC family ethanolamine operon transcriptional activator
MNARKNSLDRRPSIEADETRTKVSMKSRSFDEFDAFADSVRDVDATMMLQNPERRIWNINQVTIDGFELQLGELGSGNIVQGQAWANGTLLYLPLSRGVEYRANGIGLGPNDFMLLEPNREFCISTKYAHDWCSVFVPNHQFLFNPRKPDPVWHANRQAVTSFQYVVSEIMTASAKSSQFQMSPAAKIAAAEVKKLISCILGVPRPRSREQLGRPTIPREDVIQSCRALIDARAGEPLQVGQLAAASGVSERTLRQVFYDYYGIGPTRYLQLKQLNDAYRALRMADPEATRVGDVLTALGIWEFGRFSLRYRQLFGETPSETLRGPQAGCA